MLELKFSETFNIQVNIPQKEQKVNDLISICQKSSRLFFQVFFEKLMLRIQAHMLVLVLGSAWKPSQRIVAPWACPRCGSRYGFSRRGKRTRIMKTFHGKVRYPLLQLTCKDCQKTFSPFPALLGIHSRHQFTQELEQKLCSMVKDVSFSKTAKFVNLMCNLRLSPYSIHRVVQRYGTQAKIVEDLRTITRLESDSTKIKASANERGIDVHIALAVGGCTCKGKRVIREKTLAVLEVAKSPEKTKRLLRQSHIDQVIVDGHSGLERYIEENKLPITVQRCLWHIPRTAVHMLWKDGLSADAGRALVKPMKTILFDESLPVHERLEKYDALTDTVRMQNDDNTCTFLENARANLFTYKQFADQDNYGRTISVVERQMREVNRRMENGGRWTPKGAQNLLTLKFIEELNPLSYDYLWNIRKKRKSSFEVILC